MKQEALLIFDVGKTNKKVLLFDPSLDLLREEEEVFGEIPDDDGFPGEDIKKVEEWIRETCNTYLYDNEFDIRGINFSTYGASLIYLDAGGNRLTPLYNYLKPMPRGIVEPVYDEYGGKVEFCRITASPALGMLNSGFQALWLKGCKPEVFGKVSRILHFPQYLSYLLTGNVCSEHTSIGCHTALWDFNSMDYHPWTGRLGKVLPGPLPVTTTFPSRLPGLRVPVGIGIHDSSSSLAPYLLYFDEPFILVSTGTWCISMNPFNGEPLTAEQLGKDCLQYLSIGNRPVKSSRLFLGHIHDVNVENLARIYEVPCGAFRRMEPDPVIIRTTEQRSNGYRRFFSNGVPDNYVDTSVRAEMFGSCEEAYHQMMRDLVGLTFESVSMIMAEQDETRNIIITGGFSRNPLFVEFMTRKFKGKKVFTSHIPNATSAGAALVLRKALYPDQSLPVIKGLNVWEDGEKGDFSDRPQNG